MEAQGCACLWPPGQVTANILIGYSDEISIGVARGGRRGLRKFGATGKHKTEQHERVS
jgi:hypothetical protein